MSRTVLAAQLYTVREFTKTPDAIAETFAKVRKMGYRAVQTSALGPIEPKALRKIAKSEGLTICATHIGFDRLLNDMPGVIDEHKTIGCDNVAIGSMPVDYRTGAEKVKEFARLANDAGAKLREAGLSFSYHNHSFEFEKVEGKLIMDLIYENSAPENVLSELDTYWVQHGGADPAAWVTKLSNRLTLLHLKDMTMRGREQLMAEIGEGNLNWPAILKAAKKAKVRWYIVEQDTCQRDPFESLAISLKNLQAMGLK